jgi:hypothetical protein
MTLKMGTEPPVIEAIPEIAQAAAFFGRSRVDHV